MATMCPPSPSESCDEDSFEDASERVVIPTNMDLKSSIDETVVALNLFLNNKFAEAKARMEPWAHSSMYHAMGYGTLMYLQAAMTFDMSDIEAAVKAVKNCLVICNQHRKKASLINHFTRVGSKANYDDYTEEEVHAELCYAECLIERALLCFVQNESLISLLQGSFKIRACYHSYRECLKILQKRTWESNKQKLHFESGVRLGIGLFNLMISLLPKKALKLLEFVGFSGNKSFGLSQLEHGASQEQSLRGPLCSLSLLCYHTEMTYIFGTGDGDTVLSEKLLKSSLKYYPKGALFLFFAGRIEEIKGNIDEAINRFEDSVDAQEEWRQFHHLCFWELMWCHSFKCDWLLAMKYAERLCKESRWSRVTYTYQKAAFLLMCEDMTADTVDHVQNLMGHIPKLKQRIAGKSIPIEKFAVRKAERFIEQDGMLVLPAIELIYVWNGFFIIAKNPQLLMNIMQIVEKAITNIVANKDTLPNYVDNYSLALLIKGVCLRHRGQYMQAEQCLTEVIESKKLLKYDTYLVPFATLELALLQMATGELKTAKHTLDSVISKHKGYALESRLHFRVHAAGIELESLMNPSTVTTQTHDKYEQELIDAPSDLALYDDDAVVDSDDQH